MTADSHIRQAGPADLVGLADVAQRSYAHTFAHTMSSEQLNEELTEFRSEKYFSEAIKHDVVLVYEDDGRILGYAQIADANFPEVKHQPGDQLLDRLYVDPDAHGRGIGRRLLQAAMQHPRLARAGRVFLQVMSDNHRAVSLYRSVGFEAVGTTRLGVGDLQETDELIMMRPAQVREPV
jgi:ribosomal protein S18 acetylase RimI-like enzyme